MQDVASMMHSFSKFSSMLNSHWVQALYSWLFCFVFECKLTFEKRYSQKCILKMSALQSFASSELTFWSFWWQGRKFSKVSSLHNSPCTISVHSWLLKNCASSAYNQCTDEFFMKFLKNLWLKNQRIWVEEGRTSSHVPQWGLVLPPTTSTNTPFVWGL